MSLPSSPSPSPLLRELLEARSQLREDLLRRVRTSPHGEADPGPTGQTPSAWTPDQVLQHLERVEALVLERLPGAASHPPPSLRHRVGRIVLRVVFLFRIRVRMPLRRIAPGPPADPETVGKAWAATAARLDRALVEAEAQDPGAPTLVHPVSGPMTPVRTARFLLDHARHHGHQVDRLLRTPGRGG